MSGMRRFVLARHADPSGISGTGIVAEGIEWRGGTADLHWVTDHETFVHWPGGIGAILAVHGHQGSTIVRWLDDEPPDPHNGLYGPGPTSLAPGWEDLLDGETYDYPDNDAHDPRD
jgi:hypothetical protein